jgi:hypothetical protein
MPVADSIDGLAALAARGAPTHAARLLGVTDRVRAEGRLATWDPATRAGTVATVEALLGPEEVARLRAEGHALGLAAVDSVALLTW